MIRTSLSAGLAGFALAGSAQAKPVIPDDAIASGPDGMAEALVLQRGERLE